MARVAGTAYVDADGMEFQVVGDCEVQPSKIKRTPIVAGGQTVGYKEEPITPYVDFEAATIPGISTTKIDQITNATVTVELANGTNYILRNAWTAGELKVSAMEGKVGKVHFDGKDCQEITG